MPLKNIRILTNSDNMKMLTAAQRAGISTSLSIYNDKGVFKFKEKIKIPTVTPGHHSDLVNFYLYVIKNLYLTQCLSFYWIECSEQMYPSRPNIVKNRKFCLLTTYLLVLNVHLGISLAQHIRKSLNSIDEWCKEDGLRIIASETHSVMFTWKRKLNFSLPLKIDNDIVEVESSTKFLGVVLDSKLAWNEHISNQCKKAKGILMQCRKSVGRTWGFTPKTMKWIYTAGVRPILSYGAVIWINGLITKNNITLLNSVQR